MTDPVLLVPPADLLTVEEARLHLRVDHFEEDALIRGLIGAATGWMDGWRGVLGRCILTQTWAIKADALATMRLPFPDVQSAIVTYLDPAGASQTVQAENYLVRTVNGLGELVFAPDFVPPAILPGRDDAVTVSAVFGWPAAPPSLKVAALMLVAHWYQNREAVVTGTIASEVPLTVETMIAPYRVALV